MRNLGQSHCRWCTKAYGFCKAYGCLSDESKDELWKFKDENGHYWRAKLRTLWMNGSEVLREVRNKVGPTDLAKVKPVRRVDKPKRRNMFKVAEEHERNEQGKQS